MFVSLDKYITQYPRDRLFHCLTSKSYEQVVLGAAVGSRLEARVRYGSSGQALQPYFRLRRKRVGLQRQLRARDNCKQDIQKRVSIPRSSARSPPFSAELDNVELIKAGGLVPPSQGRSIETLATNVWWPF